MKKFLLILMFILLNVTACNAEEDKQGIVVSKMKMFDIEESSKETDLTSEIKEGNMIDVNIKIGSSNFSAKLYDNETTRQLIKKFPATYNMSELHGNEKYYYMADALSANSEKPSTINKGEIMLYGSDCLVIFYDTFPNSYSYTRLGYIEKTSGLENAVGKGEVDIKFEMK